MEAAAVVFKKVVLQRRKEKEKEKAAEEGEYNAVSSLLCVCVCVSVWGSIINSAVLLMVMVRVRVVVMVLVTCVSNSCFMQTLTFCLILPKLIRYPFEDLGVPFT